MERLKERVPFSKTNYDLLLEKGQNIISETEKELYQEQFLREVAYELEVFECFVNRLRTLDEEHGWEEIQIYNAYCIKRVEEAIAVHKRMIEDENCRENESVYTVLSGQLRMSKLQENERVLRLLTDIETLLCDYICNETKRLLKDFGEKKNENRVDVEQKQEVKNSGRFTRKGLDSLLPEYLRGK
ncbi:MAG: hypothetical protein IKY23_12360 [Lachnospiraceae bacterium]|nr:hypothetical protein [Lachnospiraceae bacterium]